MATQNAINQGDSTRVFTGIQSWLGAGAYFDDTTLGSFTLSRAGNGYIKGKPVSWAGSQTVTGLAAGTLYWICIDSTGTLVKFDAFSPTIFTDNIPLFECLRDSTSPTNNQYTVREDHPYWVEANTSIYLHNVIGPVIRNTNNGANITLLGTQQIQIVGADYLEDHGLTTTISDSGGAAVTFRKVFTNASGKWCTYNNTDTFSGHYNNAGTVAALSAGQFGVYTLYVSKDNITSATPTYYAVLNTAQFSSSTNANTAIANGTTARATAELYNLELAQLGYIIFRQSTNAITTVTVSKATLKQTLSTSGSNIAANITTNITNFDGILSSADTNVQAALETINDWGKAPNLPTTTSTVGQIKINSAQFLHALGTGNTFLGGAGNLAFNTSYNAYNVGIGLYALEDLAGAGANEGNENAAVGYAAGANITSGRGNAFLGKSAGNSVTSGNFNCIIGFNAGYGSITTGVNNVIIGDSSGSAYASDESSNIVIGSGIAGTTGEDNVLRIGKATGTGTSEINVCYISGITGKTSTSGAAVYVNSSNVLGTSTSSIRYKEDVKDMSEMSQICAKLRPVTFRFKEDYPDKPLQYGLIAEEVEKVWPEMVLYDAEGKPCNLSYNFLAPMLLSEIQRLTKRIEELETRVLGEKNV